MIYQFPNLLDFVLVSLKESVPPGLIAFVKQSFYSENQKTLCFWTSCMVFLLVYLGPFGASIEIQKAP